MLLLVDLSPSQYINDVVRKGHQRANLILRCFVSQNVNLLVRAFVVYVRPLLEYNSSVWSPSLKRDVTLVFGKSPLDLFNQTSSWLSGPFLP